MIAATHLNDVTELTVTDGTIALLNLQAQIDGLEPDVSLSHTTVESRVGLIELITLRGSSSAKSPIMSGQTEWRNNSCATHPLTGPLLSHVREQGLSSIGLPML